MPDIGWMELLVIGVVALIVVGPKDLPMMFRRLGEYTGRIRAMAKDFQRAMDDAADEAGIGDIKRDMQNMSKYTNPKKMGMDALQETFDEIDPSKYEEGSETRKIAEEKAAHHKEQRELAAARRKAREDATIAKKEAAMAPPPQMGDADTGVTPDATAEMAEDATLEPGIRASRMGHSDT